MNRNGEGRQLRAAERAANHLIDWLRLAGARPITQAVLRLARFLLRHEPAVVPLRAGKDAPPGPFDVRPAPDGPALLIFVPLRLRSRIIDAGTGGYGYSHMAVDCGEIDRATGKRVMIESAPQHRVSRSFLDVYGPRPSLRVPLSAAGIDPEAFCACVKSKIGQAYDIAEALTWGEVDDPAKQICSDLAAVCLPRAMLEDMADRHSAKQLPRGSVSAHHRFGPDFRAFVSPNAFAAYFGGPPGERLTAPSQPMSVRSRKSGHAIT